MSKEKMSSTPLLLAFSPATADNSAARRLSAFLRTAGAGRANSEIVGMIQLFVYLQALDVITTLIGFKMGAAEASPFVRVLLHAGPVAGLLLSKLIGLTLIGICVYTRRYRLIRWANYWYSALAIWNLFIILLSISPR